MTRPTTAVFGPAAWEDAQNQLLYAFSLRSSGADTNGETPSVNTAFGSWELVGQVGRGAVALDMRSGQQTALPEEYADKLVVATFARFPDEVSEGSRNVLLLSGRHIPADLAIGVGCGATAGLKLRRTRDALEGLELVNSRHPSVIHIFHKDTLLDYGAVRALFADGGSAETVADRINHNGAH